MHTLSQNNLRGELSKFMYLLGMLYAPAKFHITTFGLLDFR